MPFSYNPLWKKLIDLGMTKKEFRQKANISKSTLDRMGRNEYIALKVVDQICTKLQCTPNDIMEHIPNNEINE
ncbi:MAG: hypothetical protein DBY45_08100 [Clostridiales bacterium]|nr:MAG: hypothetical protein DBY45_08100 [Clostridiales bacterium]